MQPIIQSKQAHVRVTDELFCWLTPEGLMSALKPAFLAVIGRNEEHWLGQKFSSLIHSADAPDFERLFASALLGESASMEAVKCRTPNGEHLTLDLLLNPVASDEGTSDVIIFGRNALTPSDRTESRKVIPLRRVENLPLGASVSASGFTDLLETLLANTPIGVALLDRELRFICINQALTMLHGYSPEQHLGQTVWELDAGIAALTAPALKSVLHTGIPITDVEVNLGCGSHPDLRRCCLVSHYPVRSRDGEIVNVAQMVIDITDRKRAERALRESEDRLRIAIESANLGTWDLNLKENTVLWSERTKVMAGFSSSAKISYEDFLSGLHPSDRARVEQAIVKAKSSGGDGDYRIDYRTVGRDDGLERWLAVRGKVIFDESRCPVRFTGISLDVTEQKKADETLRRVSDELSRSNEALESFAYVASHDLKEPLRMISSFIKLLRDRYGSGLDASANEFIAYAIGGAERMRILIDDVLAYAKAGNMDRPLKQVRCDDLLAQTIEVLRFAIRDVGAVITSERLPEVDGDASQLQQAFQNIIHNAIKFRRPGVIPRIHVTAKRRGREWVFSFRDNGLGVDPKRAKEIFLPLRRLHSIADIPGSGLGLNICERNIARHSGKIWVEPNDEAGANFCFTLPVGDLK